MSLFRETAVAYFRDEVGPGMLQRIDGIRCFSPLTKFWFWQLRLDFLVREGVLQRRRMGSIWRSCDGMPAYGLASTKE